MENFWSAGICLEYESEPTPWYNQNFLWWAPLENLWKATLDKF